MSSTTQFRMAVGEWDQATDEALEGLARQSIQSVSEKVIDDTTVDTGFLKGSWQPSLNQPSTAEGKEDPTGGLVRAKMAGVIGDLELGDTYFMMNNAEYALRYEFGFVGEDKLGRSYNQTGRNVVGAAFAAWPVILATEAAALGLVVS